MVGMLRRPAATAGRIEDMPGRIGKDIAVIRPGPQPDVFDHSQQGWECRCFIKAKMECAILDRRLARVANPFGIIQQTVDSLQLIRQPWSRLPCGGLCRESLKQNSHHAKLEELHPCENGHDDGAPGPHAEHALGNELQQSLSHRCDAGLEALRHVPESQPGARWKVTQHNGRADFTQHLVGKADVFDLLHDDWIAVCARCRKAASGAGSGLTARIGRY